MLKILVVVLAVCGFVIGLGASVAVNTGTFWPLNGPCAPNIGAPGLCNDEGVFTWFDAAGKKTAFATMVGAKGDPGTAATIAAGSVTTGTPAAVNNSGTQNAAVFDFVIPQGLPGKDGTNATLQGQTCHFSISGFSQDGKGNAAGVLTITTCP